MEELKNYLCDDVIGIAGDYLHGDKKYWKSEYNKKMDIIRRILLDGLVKVSVKQN